MSEEERVHVTANKMLENVPLEHHVSGDQVEEQIQVDRKRLEAMITGKPLYGSEKYLPSAEEFFQKVNELSGATISWPSRLKIGAKTKKDPYVKMLGTVEQVNCARQLIASTLKIKRDKISLRIEIPHCDHSKIIGRKGRNTQDIMRETMCHIHFPDSNRIHDSEKNNQVSISGTVGQVEKARQRLRKLSPLSITCELPNTCRYSFQEVQRNIGHPDIFVSMREERKGKVKCTLKAMEQNEIELIRAIMVLAKMYKVQDDHQLLCHTVINAHPSLEAILRDEARKDKMHWLTQQTSTHIIQTSTLENGFELFIGGPIAGVLVARKFIVGLLPAAVQFDRLIESEYNIIDKNSVENEFGITINEKWRKSRALNNATLMVLSGNEMNVCHLYRARERILNLVQSTSRTIPDPFEGFKSGQMQSMIESMRNKAQQGLSDFSVPTQFLGMQKYAQKMPNYECYESRSRLAEALLDVSTTDRTNYAQITPDPDDSPIAHSVLVGVKRIDMANSEQGHYPSREQLLLKANCAVYNGTPPKIRQPTDLWAGYGFSNSLPADILKNGLSFIDSSSSNQHDGRQTIQETSHNEQTRPITPSAGLASVLEEDEHGEDTQNSSNSNSLVGSLSSHNLPLFQQSQAQQTIPLRSRREFSASTGIFESSPLIGNDFLWDIQIFVDPAMVLAQLGCSEYLAQFRDQEIDMEAFLLLDEQNLKDVGVSTMGARKKIYNAILRLRESARMYGMRI